MGFFFLIFFLFLMESSRYFLICYCHLGNKIKSVSLQGQPEGLLDTEKQRHECTELKITVWVTCGPISVFSPFLDCPES